MSRTLRLLSAIAVILTTAIALPAAALAHDDEPRLSAEPATTWAGGTTTVRGDLATTSAVRLDLVDPEGRRLTLATVEDPENGHFQRAVVIPRSAAGGSWTIEATAGGVAVGEVAVTIGAAPPEGGQDDRAEPVSVPAGMRPTALPHKASASPPPAAPGSPAGTWSPWFVAAGAAGAALVWVRRRRRSTA